jgi:TatA/E family protein of Tat protein translocase
MFGTIGTMELVVILVIALMVFGPRKLPELGRSIGKSLGEFKRASNDLRNTLEEEIHVEEQTRREPAKPAPAAPAPANDLHPDPVPNTLGQEIDPEEPAPREAAEPAPAPANDLNPEPAPDTSGQETDPEPAPREAAEPAPAPADPANEPHQDQPGAV